jgi:transglycosylase-like protein with SLT domain/putative peptidoglycan binding protein
MRVRCVLAAAAAAALIGAPSAAAATVNYQVAGLQVALYRYGCYTGQIDGVHGPVTTQAIVSFQRKAGLEADGVAGKRTRAALGKLGRPLFGKRTLRRGMVGYDVSVLQFLLAKRGLPPKRLNSNFGAATDALVRAFQRKAGLTVDGVVGPDTQAALVGRKPKAARASRTVKESLAHWAAHYGVSPRLARALAWQESGFQQHVKSPRGAAGVMQVTPETWSFVELFVIGKQVPRTRDGNVRVGVAYLDHLLEQFEGDTRLALGAYYQGPTAVRKHGLLDETKRFVANVLALRKRF